MNDYGYLDVSVAIDQEVFRLEVSVDKVLLVQVLQRGQDFADVE